MKKIKLPYGKLIGNELGDNAEDYWTSFDLVSDDDLARYQEREFTGDFATDTLKKHNLNADIKSVNTFLSKYPKHFHFKVSKLRYDQGLPIWYVEPVNILVNDVNEVVDDKEFKATLSKKDQRFMKRFDKNQTSPVDPFDNMKQVDGQPEPHSDSGDPEKQMLNALKNKKTMELLTHLDDFEKQVIVLRFGLGGGKDYTLEQVGKIVGLDREEVRQVEARALRKLRHPDRLSDVDERSLTKDEEDDKEKYVKGMKKNKKDFKKRYGKNADAVMYATATKMAKEGKIIPGDFPLQQRDAELDKQYKKKQKEYEILKSLAAFWWNNDASPTVEKKLNQLGYDIGQVESEDGGAFVIKHGSTIMQSDSYISWTAHDLESIDEGEVVGFPQKDLSLKQINVNGVPMLKFVWDYMQHERDEEHGEDPKTGQPYKKQLGNFTGNEDPMILKKGYRQELINAYNELLNNSDDYYLPHVVRDLKDKYNIVMREGKFKELDIERQEYEEFKQKYKPFPNSRNYSDHKGTEYVFLNPSKWPHSGSVSDQQLKNLGFRLSKNGQWYMTVKKYMDVVTVLG